MSMLFPLTVYNGMVAYQYGGYFTEYQLLQNLDFDYWCTSFGFVPPSCPHSISLLDDTLATATREDMSRNATRVILPTGYVLTQNNEGNSSLTPLPMKSGFYVIGASLSNEHFILGSLEVTKNLQETAKIYRKSFDIDSSRIVIEPVNNFLLKVKRGVDKRLASGFPALFKNLDQLVHNK